MISLRGLVFPATSLLLVLLLGPAPGECPVLPHDYGLPILEARWHQASSRLASQWENPNDVLTVLLIIGGDIVQKALAQLSGGYFVPVAFSFGWVSYSINALVVAYGDGNLMPNTLYPSILINVHSGYARSNYSWILNRILRGIEASLEPLDVSLCVSKYRCKPYTQEASHDWFWWCGVITMVFQLVISALPFLLEGDWSIMLVTVTGTLLALIEGALPQWRNEKWGNRYDEKGQTFALTRGNGFQHVVVIQNAPKGCLHLESLALPQRNACSRGVKITVILLALFWILFLVNVCGIRQHTWYLLGVGFVGMIQNICVASVPRQPAAMGLSLEHVDTIKGTKVMEALMNTEERFPSVGAALVPTYFPGKLRDHEQRFWDMKANVATRLLQRFDENLEQSEHSPAPVYEAPSSAHQEKENTSRPQPAGSSNETPQSAEAPKLEQRRCSI